MTYPAWTYLWFIQRVTGNVLEPPGHECRAEHRRHDKVRGGTDWDGPLESDRHVDEVREDGRDEQGRRRDAPPPPREHDREGNERHSIEKEEEGRERLRSQMVRDEGEMHATADRHQDGGGANRPRHQAPPRMKAQSDECDE